MNLKISIPCELFDDYSKVCMTIDIIPQIDKSGKTVWLLKHECIGIKYLNFWLGEEKYDKSIRKFSNFDDCVTYLAEICHDVEFVWEKYNKEYKQAISSLTTVKNLFFPFVYRKEN